MPDTTNIINANLKSHDDYVIGADTRIYTQPAKHM